MASSIKCGMTSFIPHLHGAVIEVWEWISDLKFQNHWAIDKLSKRNFMRFEFKMSVEMIPYDAPGPDLELYDFHLPSFVQGREVT